ncbi:hypothetical protein A3Q37_01437 [Streptomyces sp. PTY087I2]|nr:hypothetical protein A3Q37_01437 [Streptomyces sp. PTY087I2]
MLGARSHLLMPVFTHLLGGLANLFAGWLHGTLDVPRERLEAHCVELVLAATTSTSGK